MGEVLESCWKAPQSGRKTFLWDRANIVSGCPTQLVRKLRNLPGTARHPGDPQEECGMRGLGGEPSFQLSPALLLLLLPLQPLSPLCLSLSILLLSYLPRDSSPHHAPAPVCLGNSVTVFLSLVFLFSLSFLSPLPLLRPSPPPSQCGCPWNGCRTPWTIAPVFLHIPLSEVGMKSWMGVRLLAEKTGEI